MLMTQLIDPYRYGLFTLLYDAEAPEGEMLIDFVDRDSKGLKHVGETPLQVNEDVKQHASKALNAIETIVVKKNKKEFERIKNDVLCYKAMANHFSNKTYAALAILRYKYSNDVRDLEKAATLLQRSVDDYKTLSTLTAFSYLYANSMQTQQRKIPMRGVDGTYKHWKEMVPVFETEINTFKKKIDSLRNNNSQTVKVVTPFANAPVQQTNKAIVLNNGVLLFNDTTFSIKNQAAELKGLQALQLSWKQQQQQSTTINFTCSKPVKVLVGYFKTQRAAFTTDTVFLKAPELETNASADNYGQAEIRISNAIAIDGLPPVNIHVYNFKSGNNK